MQLGPHTPAVISGGAQGLGAATVRALRARGAPVSVLDRNQARGAALAAETGATFLHADVTSEDSVEAALQESRTAQGVERLCVNCAGIAPAQRTVGRNGSHDMAVFEQTVAVNLVGSFRLMSKSAAAMAAAEPLPGPDGERGLIVNTASVAAFDGQVGQTAYAASKGGIRSLCLPAARDLAPLKIRVMTIAPGIFDTAMLADMPQPVRDSLAAQVPYPRRLGDSGEYAELVCFLAEAPYLNGEVVRLDGALRMGPK